MENNKEIEKKGILGGAPILPVEDKNYLVPDYSPEGTLKALKEHGVKPIEKVKVTDPITGDTKEITIDRTGTHENRLILALANPELTRDQKDHVLSMYLFERGKENVSMLVDLYRFKGQHTKETRAFTSQMRFDFEAFIKIFVEQLRAVAKDIFEGYEVKDIKKYCDECLDDLKNKRYRNAFEYALDKSPQGLLGGLLRADAYHLVTAIRNWTEADRLEEQVANVTNQRMKEKGFGIYIDATGKPYSIFTDDKVDEIVKADIIRRKELEKDE